MAEIGAWNVPAGTQKKLSIKRQDWRAEAGAIEHKNRPEAVYIILTTWAKPKLALTKAQASSTTNPENLAMAAAVQFVHEMKANIRKFGHCFDTKYFDPHSIIVTWDYSPSQATVGKRQFVEIEINIDTVNTIGMDNKPSPNPMNGKVEMLSFRELEPHITSAANKILMLDFFDIKKSNMNFASAKGAK